MLIGIYAVLSQQKDWAVFSWGDSFVLMLSPGRRKPQCGARAPSHPSGFPVPPSLRCWARDGAGGDADSGGDAGSEERWRAPPAHPGAACPQGSISECRWSRFWAGLETLGRRVYPGQLFLEEQEHHGKCRQGASGRMGFFVTPLKSWRIYLGLLWAITNSSGQYNLLHRASNEFQVVLGLAEVLCNTERCVPPRALGGKAGLEPGQEFGSHRLCSVQWQPWGAEPWQPHAPVPLQEEQRCLPTLGAHMCMERAVKDRELMSFYLQVALKCDNTGGAGTKGTSLPVLHCCIQLSKLCWNTPWNSVKFSQIWDLSQQKLPALMDWALNTFLHSQKTTLQTQQHWNYFRDKSAFCCSWLLWWTLLKVLWEVLKDP